MREVHTDVRTYTYLTIYLYLVRYLHLPTDVVRTCIPTNVVTYSYVPPPPPKRTNMLMNIRTRPPHPGTPVRTYIHTSPPPPEIFFDSYWGARVRSTRARLYRHTALGEELPLKSSTNDTLPRLLNFRRHQNLERFTLIVSLFV